MTIEFELKQLYLDIEELLGYIKTLEERIMVLELSSPYRKVRSDDDWYWEHG